MSLTIRGISKRFGNNWALRSVDLEAERGTVVGIHGGPGSGKTTLLRILGGLEKPGGGELDFEGRPLAALHKRAGASFIPAVPTSTFWTRAFGGESVHQHDAGAKQIAAVEEAIASGDSLILLDDSFRILDLETREELKEKLRAAAKEHGLVVIYATSQFQDAYGFCDKAVLIVDGNVEQEGTPEHLYEHPASAASATLTGRMNFIEARRLSSTKEEVPEFQTMIGENRIFARKTDNASLGAINSNVKLAIRPENISISFGASFPEDNLLKAKITGIKFMGPTTIVELDADGLSLEALVLRLVGLNVGEECMIGLPPDRLVVLNR
jgi:ABC-type Fe3+/spermidine/putrescine transport system ATPase subunit